MFSYNVFYYTYERGILMGEVRVNLDCGTIVWTPLFIGVVEIFGK